MTFLPIVERELRVRARMKSTYRFRLWAAIGAIVLAGMVLGGGSVKNAGQNGFIIFSALSWLSFVYCLIDGARNTADCLSEEKRSGTLGLLFLTDLRPYDVVLGKLMATSLNSFYGLLAIFPPLAIPLVVGGVTLGEFWRAVLVLMSTLFFSVSIGLAVSSACRDERRAWMSTVGILAFLTVIPPLFLLSPAWASSPVVWFSPTTAFIEAFDSRYSAAPENYWTSVGIVLSMSWAALFAAMIILPRSWQDRPPSSSAPSWWVRLTSRIAPRVEPGDFEGRAVYLESNPIVWLAARGGTRQTLLLTVVGITALIGLTAWLLSAGATAVGFTLFGLMFLIHLTISVSVASEACHLFSGARESGAMELLLCTPMTAKEVVEGHVLGLRKMFYKPVAALVTIEAVLVAGQVYVLGGSGYSLAGCILILMLSGLCILGVVMDLAAVARYGLWQGLVNRKPAKAVTRTVLWVLLVPLIPVLCSAGFLLPLIWPLKNLMFINYAREQLRRQFRSSITERAGWSEESEFIVEPANQARPNALPPVLGR